MKHTIDIQNLLESESSDLPNTAQLETWANAALSELCDVSEMSLCLVEESEIQQLNHTYRKQNKPTNVLSFPADIPEEINLALLGDVIICAAVVEKEALEQGKSLEAHWAHMTVHGSLHLLGYDHVTDEDAEVMESKEIEILAHFGYSNPYRIKEDTVRKQ